MPSPWFDVPYVFCRLRLTVSHAFRKKEAGGGADALVTSHSTDYVVAGTFRLQRMRDSLRPYFSNPKVSLRVAGWSLSGMSSGSGESAFETGTRKDFAGSTTPGPVILEIYPDDKHQANFQTQDDNAFEIKLATHSWERSGAGFNQEARDTEEGHISFLIQQPFPAKPGEVRLQDKPPFVLLNTPFCLAVTACEPPRISGSFRLTPGLPAFRIVDDTVDQNPIPHCRVRVQCPDGVAREFVADDAGEIFIPRSGKDVYTLLEVLEDAAPLCLSRPAGWTIEAMPDQP
ncbi:hypothetical protein [Corallococcus llansteffanensis]|uniref:Uncharacterized protein n=1 Tax=Corallococcus llansteffanensis TaxID=2316731 RepID=A0A3A8NTX0_9BACT|nr:hypothetical protein [Corallococcus llansteffanensis]RKH45631.1 hypothetical protein D7V93_35350 [Corallococcus llansteffanensis]